MLCYLIRVDCEFVSGLVEKNFQENFVKISRNAWEYMFLVDGLVVNKKKDFVQISSKLIDFSYLTMQSLFDQ